MEMETIKDIVAEMRNKTAKSKEEAWYDAKRWAELCDRLEAAWTEEAKAIAVENAVLPAVCITKMSGNPASMRDHLKFKFVNGFGIEFPTDIGSAPLNTNLVKNVNSDAAIYNGAKIREALGNIVQHFCANCPNNGPDGCELSEAEGRFEFLCHKLKQARAAISAPPRNCDLYKTLDDARNAFFADYVPDETCSSATAFAIWLFSKAEGGAK